MGKMKLTEAEISKLKKCSNEKDWYDVCNEIKSKRNGQYPPYLSREILDLYQDKFPPEIS
tara:strand:- start:264 stop:443 length:180 start_codon:yes stop_codon:yes gene_type:complete